MDGIELLCFQLISEVGSAKSFFIEAIQAAKAGEYTRATELIKEGDECFVKGHHVHSEMLSLEGVELKALNLTLLLIHAEDQLMSAETLKIVAEEMIELYQRIEK